MWLLVSLLYGLSVRFYKSSLVPCRVIGYWCVYLGINTISLFPVVATGYWSERTVILLSLFQCCVAGLSTLIYSTSTSVLSIVFYCYISFRVALMTFGDMLHFCLRVSQLVQRSVNRKRRKHFDARHFSLPFSFPPFSQSIERMGKESGFLHGQTFFGLRCVWGRRRSIEYYTLFLPPLRLSANQYRELHRRKEKNQRF